MYIENENTCHFISQKCVILFCNSFGYGIVHLGEAQQHKILILCLQMDISYDGFPQGCANSAPAGQMIVKHATKDILLPSTHFNGKISERQRRQKCQKLNFISGLCCKVLSLNRIKWLTQFSSYTASLSTILCDFQCRPTISTGGKIEKRCTKLPE